MKLLCNGQVVSPSKALLTRAEVEKKDDGAAIWTPPPAVKGILSIQCFSASSP